MEEYVRFTGLRGQSSPFFGVRHDVKQETTFLGFDSRHGECLFRTLYLQNMSFAPAFRKSSIPVFKPYTVAVLFKFAPKKNKINSIFVRYTTEFLGYFLSNLDSTPATASFVCTALQTKGCTATWQLNKLKSHADCVARYNAIPMLAQSDTLYIDGNSRGCRMLHSVFALKNSKYCAHLSFIPQADTNGNTKCQKSAAMDVNLGEFTAEDLEALAIFRQPNDSEFLV